MVIIKILILSAVFIFAILVAIVANNDVNTANAALLNRQKHKNQNVGKKVRHKFLNKEFIIADIRHKYLTSYPYTTLDFDMLCRDQDGSIKSFNHKELELVKN